jgi:hypothetical protein
MAERHRGPAFDAFRHQREPQGNGCAFYVSAACCRLCTKTAQDTDLVVPVIHRADVQLENQIRRLSRAAVILHDKPFWSTTNDADYRTSSW